MAKPTNGATTAMLSAFAPKAVIPPSAKNSACTARTAESTSTAGQGPRMIAHAAPPAKWPVVPPATGKFSICRAKTSALMTAMSTIRCCESRSRVHRTA